MPNNRDLRPAEPALNDDIVGYVTELKSCRKCDDCDNAGEFRWLAIARTIDSKRRGILCRFCLDYKFSHIQCRLNHITAHVHSWW